MQRIASPTRLWSLKRCRRPRQSLPTVRSSRPAASTRSLQRRPPPTGTGAIGYRSEPPPWWHSRSARTAAARRRGQRIRRSEEHTSELQSHSDLVCRLLLEKKNTKKLQKKITAQLSRRDIRNRAN